MTRNQRTDRSDESASTSDREQRHSCVRRSSTRSAESGRAGNTVHGRGPDADRGRTADAESGQTGDVRWVQRVLGNQRLQRLFRGTGSRAPPEVGDPTGRYEYEADRIAERVVGGRPATRQSERGPRAEDSSPDGKAESLAVGAAPRDGRPGPRLKRELAGERNSRNEHDADSRHESDPGNSREPDLDSRDGPSGLGSLTTVGGDRRAVVRSFAGTGRPLRESTQSYFESRLGYDLGGVRVYTGPRADAAARAVDAKAFTYGRDVVFRSGEYRLGTELGTRLLAHELVHVVQQTAVSGTADASAARGDVSRAPLMLQRAYSVTPYVGLPAGFAGPPAPLGPDNCITTSTTGGTRTSDQPLQVYYEKDNTNQGEISLRQRERGDEKLSTAEVPAESKQGWVSLGDGIPIQNEDHHYELQFVFWNRKGVEYGGLNPRPVARFEVCRLKPAPTGIDLTFAKMLYAEGSDAGEFPWVRDLVYNRIDWVKTCPADEKWFGAPNVEAVLTHPNQFASVLNETAKFKELEQELKTHSGPCQYTTPPRSTAPARCRLVNAAIEAQAAGDGNTHDYVFFRSDTRKPSDRAINMKQYPGGNYYWEISGCPGK